MEDEELLPPPLQIPCRIFAAGKEPVGVRVTPYHKPYAIRQILNALDVEEVETIKASPFGKLVEIGEKPSFSGRFGRFIISRKLKVSKKHEAWFIFAGKPVRFSLREFAYVTGLNCGKLSRHTKKRAKKNISEKPYWGELFGTLKDVLVTFVVRMLKRRTVTDRCMREKYALLALLAAVILPTTHTPRISQDHAEFIKDLDIFFAYPWGRISFDMLMSSIKERKEVSLSQNTIALKGFVLSLQLVMVEAIPALTEVVNDGSSSASEGDCVEDDDIVDEDKNGKRSISPGHARDTDASGKVEVHSVIVQDQDHFKTSSELSWSDEEDDPMVDNLLTLVEDQFPFNKSSFIGGVTKTKQTSHSATGEGIDYEFVASLVRDKVGEDLSRIERQINILSESFLKFQTNVNANIALLIRKLDGPSGHIPANSTGQPANVFNHATDVQQTGFSGPSQSHVGIQTESVQNGIISDAIRFANEATTFTMDGLIARQTSRCEQPSEGLPSQRNEKKDMLNSQDNLSFLNRTQASAVKDEPPQVRESVNEGPNILEHIAGKEMCDSEDPLVACQKSKRHKALPKSLVGQYECDKRLLNHARAALVDPNNTGGNVDYSAKFAVLLAKLNSPFTIILGQLTLEGNDLYEIVKRSAPLQAKVVDVLMGHIRSQFTLNSPANQSNHPEFLDTQFVSQLSKLFPKFSKMSRKGSFRFPSNILQRFVSNPEADRYYFPFTIDKKHWVGVCVDCSTWTIAVMDCNIALRSDNMMIKEVTPIAQMFPYILKQGGKQLLHKDARAFPIKRPRCIPQNTRPADSGLSAVLFMQAQAIAGVDVCNCITQEVLGHEVERLAVMFYEATVGML
ncbi:hypothetical protein N665_0252s0010 [Sinapis alba]|nr:hypothetical protein N665_0252s0010 [Sinapis alba]